MAESEGVLDHLDFPTPIPCYYLDPEASTLEELGAIGFDCADASAYLVVWTCGVGHRTEAPFCGEHAKARPGVDCWTCGAPSWPGYCRTLPCDYWPGAE